MPPGWQRLMRLPFETTGTNVMYRGMTDVAIMF